MEQQFKKSTTARLGRYWPVLALPLALLKPAVGQAQQSPPPDSTGRAIPGLPVLGDSLRVQLEYKLDSLAAVPLGPTVVDSVRLEWLRTPPTMRDLVCDRVNCFETDVPHAFNNSVMAYVTLFTARNRSYMQRVLEREQFYFPIFEKYLAQYNLPTDLKYLAVVESALIPTAKSPVGATGLWQFMGPTAGDLRLKRDEWIDERMAPEKATEAACKHLRYLYGVFHDWELVLAAYNWGAGNVQRVMRRTGKKNFWDLYPNMPAETRNYVPTFTAIMYSMKYAQSHGLHSDKLKYQYAEALDTLGLRGQAFDLRRLSRACGYADSTFLTRYNPELRHAALPAGYRPYVVRYPAAARPHLEGVDHATLLDYCQPAALPQAMVPLPPRLAGIEPFPMRQLLAATDGPRTDAETAAPRFRRVRHTVRRGETLAAVAEKFEVSQAQLRRWNELPKGKALKPGRKLVVFQPLPASAAPTKAASEPMLAAATVPAPKMARTAVADEEAIARKELAVANAREVARLAALAEEEKRQVVRLAALRQRQEVLNKAAAAKVAMAALTRQVAEDKAAKALAPANKETHAEVLVAASESAAEAQPMAIMPARTRKTSNEPAAKEHLAVDDTLPATYVVRKGDYLTRVAREHDLTIAQLTAWNRLESQTVVPGQRLLLHAPNGNEAELELHKPARAMAAGAAAEKPAARAVARHSAPEKTGGKIHLVQPGDTLYNISRRFKVSVDELRRLNNLASDEVKLGQKLLLPQG
jgi:membrane-bound lytic murein transglycosylase D